MKTKKSDLIYQFKITLCDIAPPIWRRVQIPAKCSFWDLHVAIQDSMGWLDYHLHAFYLYKRNKRSRIEIGIPDDEFVDHKILPGWEIRIRECFIEPGAVADYKYDFGDGWNHEVLLEGILLKEEEAKYPRCIAGERACPPEDCGGVHGYYRLLEILSNPKHDEYQNMVQWLRYHEKNYYPYLPDEFEPQAVHFDDPRKRWKLAFPEGH